MRNNYISFDTLFMELAKITAQRSKDSDKQVGACIVDTSNKVIALGYNGLPYGIKDSNKVWDNTTKKHLVVHAELNAILNATQSLIGSKLYCTLKPCNECAKAIVQSGIKEVIYLEDFKPNADYMVASKKILKCGHVKVRKFKVK